MTGNTEPAAQAEPALFTGASSAVFGFGQGSGSQLAASVPQVPDARDIEIAPDKVLAVAKVIEDQAGELERKLADQLAALRIQSPSDDIVSVNVVEAWNEVVAGGAGSYERKVREYVRGLRDLAEQLRTASEHYQVSEDDKAAAFGDRRVYEA